MKILKNHLKYALKRTKCGVEFIVKKRHEVAFVLVTRAHELPWELLALLSNLKLEIMAVYSDDNFVYHEAIPNNILKTSKKNTQRIEKSISHSVQG